MRIKIKKELSKCLGDSQKWLSFFVEEKSHDIFYLQKQKISCKILRYKKTGGKMVENQRIAEDIVKRFKIDGKEEDLKYYEDIFDVYDFIEQEKFLILGHKGTGKTYFLKKIKEIKEKHNFKIINCNMEKFYLILNKLDKNKVKDIRKELDMIWKFMIFIEIFKKIKDERMDGKNKKILRLIKKFLQKNSFLLNLSSDKILERIINKEIETEIETNFLKKIFSGLKNKFSIREQKNL